MKQALIAAIMLFSTGIAFAGEQQINGKDVVNPVDTTIPAPACDTATCKLTSMDVKFMMDENSRIVYTPSMDDANRACAILHTNEKIEGLPWLVVYKMDVGMQVWVDCKN